MPKLDTAIRFPDGNPVQSPALAALATLTAFQDAIKRSAECVRILPYKLALEEIEAISKDLGEFESLFYLAFVNGLSSGLDLAKSMTADEVSA
jgi:hypothetical protein